MKNTLITIIGVILVTAVAVQGFYLYRLTNQIESLDSAGTAVTTKQDDVLGIPDDLFDPNGMDPQAWDPGEEIRRMQERMNHLFSESFSRLRQDQHLEELFGGNRFTPSLDLNDKGDEYKLKINLPGAEESNIDVTIENDKVLTIEATTKDSNELKDEGSILRRERYIGQFRRQLTLPEAVDPNSLESDYEDGVLTLSVKKKPALG